MWIRLAPQKRVPTAKVGQKGGPISDTHCYDLLSKYLFWVLRNVYDIYKVKIISEYSYFTTAGPKTKILAVPNEIRYV
jgi:hypothetical protein